MMKQEKKNDVQLEPSVIQDLQRQYPWFNRTEIEEVASRFGHRYERILAYLDMKSGRWSVVEAE